MNSDVFDKILKDGLHYLLCDNKTLDDTSYALYLHFKLSIFRCSFCNCCNTACFPFGNNSLLSTFHSIDILPGPVSKRLIDIASNIKSTSYPPTNPFDSLAVIVEPIISIINKIEAALVKTPTSKAIPPITSSSPTGRANEAGNPIVLTKKCSVPGMLKSLGKP